MVNGNGLDILNIFDGLIGFWIFWMCVVVGCVSIFYYNWGSDLDFVVEEGFSVFDFEIVSVVGGLEVCECGFFECVEIMG